MRVTALPARQRALEAIWYVVGVMCEVVTVAQELKDAVVAAQSGLEHLRYELKFILNVGRKLRHTNLGFEGEVEEQEQWEEPRRCASEAMGTDSTTGDTRGLT
jgi:hypothetical protein